MELGAPQQLRRNMVLNFEPVLEEAESVIEISSKIQMFMLQHKLTQTEVILLFSDHMSANFIQVFELCWDANSLCSLRVLCSFAIVDQNEMQKLGQSKNYCRA